MKPAASGNIAKENLKTLKYHTFQIKRQVFLLIMISVAGMMKKYLRRIEILKTIGLINNMNQQYIFYLTAIYILPEIYILHMPNNDYKI